MKNYLDLGNSLVIGLTVILFMVALFIKGFTHDLLLEAGVLLVSVKLVLMNYKNAQTNTALAEKIEDLKQIILEQKSKP